MDTYYALKFAHIVIAIFALGTGMANGIALTFFANHPAHGAFVQRVARKLLHVVVLPGYVLMLATGMWMGHMAALLDARWTEAARKLWGVGAVFCRVTSLALRGLTRLLEADGGASPNYRRAALMTSVCGAAAGAIILIIVGFMVFKPA